METGLSIETVRTGVELRITGRLDAHTAAAARSALQTAIEDGVGELRVAVPDLEIWDASGLGVLVGAQRRARQAGRRIALVEVSARQLRLLRATRLHRVLGVQADPAQVTSDLLPRPVGARSWTAEAGAGRTG